MKRILMTSGLSKATILLTIGVHIFGCASAHRIIEKSDCNSIYATSISNPVIFTDKTIKIKQNAVVRLETIGEQEDTITVDVNGNKFYHNRALPLKIGMNTVDFVVTGEGDVHYWHGVIKVDGKVVFEHQQNKLPAKVCRGNIYRYRLKFDVVVGEPIAAETKLVTSSDISPESYRVKSVPPASPAGLDDDLQKERSDTKVAHMTLPADRAELYIFRFDVDDELAVPVIVYVKKNARDLGVVRPGEFIRLELVPGEYEIFYYPTNDLTTPIQERAQTNVQPITLAPGQRHYVLYRVSDPSQPLVEEAINRPWGIIRSRDEVLSRVRYFTLPGEIARGAMKGLRQWVKSTLPVIPPLGMESNSYMIRASGKEGITTAAGQIFTPSSQTPVLFKLGFMFTQYSFTKRVPGFKLQIRLSEWAGDRPGPKELWVSEPRAVPSNTRDFQADWVDFNVPHLLLDPAKQYIAWVTLSGLANQSDASVGIPGMGPRYSSPPPDNKRRQGSGISPYPQGMRALYKQANPDGNVSQMTSSAWEVHNIGCNLHFRMSFEN